MSSGDLPPNPETPRYEYRVVRSDGSAYTFDPVSLAHAKTLVRRFNNPPCVGAPYRIQRRELPTWEDV